jgi:SAM-dependent methyltransferase
METLETIETSFPAVTGFLQDAASYFRIPLALARRRLDEGLTKLGQAKAIRICCEWALVRQHSSSGPVTEKQAIALWNSPFFQLFLDAVLQFYPPVTSDVRVGLPAPCREVNEVWQREVFDLASHPYWKAALSLCLPELYLDPFLADKNSGNAIGCDLACGWGRASFALRSFANRHIYCCDTSLPSLQLLGSLARNSGIGDYIIPVRGGVTALPFADCTFDFFLAFDIFEHLAENSITSCLREILRCAKPGAILYTEIPLHSHFPAITHFRDFSHEKIADHFQGVSCMGRGFELTMIDRSLPSHFAFKVRCH